MVAHQDAHSSVSNAHVLVKGVEAVSKKSAGTLSVVPVSPSSIHRVMPVEFYFEDKHSILTASGKELITLNEVVEEGTPVFIWWEFLSLKK
jgi:hypothetical protein